MKIFSVASDMDIKMLLRRDSTMIRCNPVTVYDVWNKHWFPIYLLNKYLLNQHWIASKMSKSDSFAISKYTLFIKVWFFGLLLSYPELNSQLTIFSSAVQHERAPRSCMPNAHLSAGLIGAHTDPKGFPSIHQLPLHHPHNRLFLPMPIHLPTAFTDSPLSRHYSHFNAFHPNVFDSLHFAAANGNLLAPQPPAPAGVPPLPPPPSLISTGSPPSEPSIEARENMFLHPLHAFKALPSKNESHILQTSPFHMPGTFPTPTHKYTKDVNGKEDEVSSSEEILTLHSLASSSPSSATTTQNDQDIIFESAAKLLILTVKWARSIPSFNQLNVIDQNILLEECWAELFIIMSAQYGLPIGSKASLKSNYMVFFSFFVATIFHSWFLTIFESKRSFIYSCVHVCWVFFVWFSIKYRFNDVIERSSDTTIA